MTRRRKPAAQRTAVQWMTWKPDYAVLFDLVAEDWSPPDRVKVQRTQRGSTWTAIFTTPCGEHPCCIVRLRHGPPPITDCDIVDTRVRFSWRVPGPLSRSASTPEAEVQS